MAEIKPKAGIKPGIDVAIGGVTYVAPPMNFGALRQMRQLKVSESYQDDLMAFILVSSLSRNYDGVDVLWLNENLEGSELDAAGKAILEIMKASGLKAPEDAKSGEATAAA